MALGKAFIEIQNALAARLSSRAVRVHRVGMRGGGTHWHFDNNDRIVLIVVDRALRVYGSDVDECCVAMVCNVKRGS